MTTLEHSAPQVLATVCRYEITDRFTVTPPSGSVDALDVWCPVIPDTPTQRVLELEVHAEHPFELTRDVVLGQALEAAEAGTEDCEVCGYHCWAEFFVTGLGWLPADASCATKYGTHSLFGNLEANHIAWSTGRDLLLAPPQRAGRSLFFAAPYAEADGSPHPVDRRIAFTPAP